MNELVFQQAMNRVLANQYVIMEAMSYLDETSPGVQMSLREAMSRTEKIRENVARDSVEE